MCVNVIPPGLVTCAGDVNYLVFVSKAISTKNFQREHEDPLHKVYRGPVKFNSLIPHKEIKSVDDLHLPHILSRLAILMTYINNIHWIVLKVIYL